MKRIVRSGSVPSFSDHIQLLSQDIQRQSKDDSDINDKRHYGNVWKYSKHSYKTIVKNFDKWNQERLVTSFMEKCYRTPTHWQIDFDLFNNGEITFDIPFAYDLMKPDDRAVIFEFIKSNLKETIKKISENETNEEETEEEEFNDSENEDQEDESTENQNTKQNEDFLVELNKMEDPTLQLFIPEAINESIQMSKSTFQKLLGKQEVANESQNINEESKKKIKAISLVYYVQYGQTIGKRQKNGKSTFL